MIEKGRTADAVKLAALKEAARLGMVSIEAGDVRTFAEPASMHRHLKDLAVKAIGNLKSDK